jgi:hypothetical protein
MRRPTGSAKANPIPIARLRATASLMRRELKDEEPDRTRRPGRAAEVAALAVGGTATPAFYL